VKPAALVALAVLFSGCAAMRQTVPIALGGNTPAAPSSAPVYAPAAVSAAPAGPVKLMLFGGSGHRTYLGCLTCPEYDTDSVFCSYGDHGSTYSSTSIHTTYGEFGSSYSSYSACSTYASDPPVIVDQNGGYYGRFSITSYSHADSVCGYGRFANDTACKLVNKICGGN
jgi:hypothetical protein